MRKVESAEQDQVSGGLFAGDAGNARVYQINGGDLANCAAAAGAAAKAGGAQRTRGSCSRGRVLEPGWRSVPSPAGGS